MITEWTNTDAVQLRIVFQKAELELLRAIPRDERVAGYMLAIDVLRSLTSDRMENSATAEFVDMSSTKTKE